MIKLHTEWNAEFQDFDGTMREKNHDVAVAHALVKALHETTVYGEDCDSGLADSTIERAAEILRDDFGIVQ